MEKKTNTVRTQVILGVIVLALVCVGGWVFSSVFINIQEQGCQFIEAGIEQFGGQSDQVQPRTAEECLKAIEMATPFYRLWGWLFTGILTVGGLMTLYATITIFGRKTTSERLKW